MPRKRTKKPDQPKRPRGRPPSIVIDEKTLEQIKSLGGLQCTQGEAAAILKISRSKFESLLGTNTKVREAWEEGREYGRGSLRRMQYENAKNGNVSMQIWLGKQWLGQKDKQEIGGDAENPLAFTVLTGVPRAEDD